METGFVTHSIVATTNGFTFTVENTKSKAIVALVFNWLAVDDEKVKVIYGDVTGAGLGDLAIPNYADQLDTR